MPSRIGKKKRHTREVAGQTLSDAPDKTQGNLEQAELLVEAA
jgi:hypothetical protein